MVVVEQVVLDVLQESLVIIHHGNCSGYSGSCTGLAVRQQYSGIQRNAVWNATTDEEKKAWTEYRIALLNIPQQEGFPWGGDSEKVPWPKIPE